MNALTLGFRNTWLWFLLGGWLAATQVLAEVPSFPVPDAQRGRWRYRESPGGRIVWRGHFGRGLTPYGAAVLMHFADVAGSVAGDILGGKGPDYPALDLNQFAAVRQNATDLHAAIARNVPYTGAAPVAPQSASLVKQYLQWSDDRVTFLLSSSPRKEDRDRLVSQARQLLADAREAISGVASSDAKVRDALQQMVQDLESSVDLLSKISIGPTPATVLGAEIEKWKQETEDLLAATMPAADLDAVIGAWLAWLGLEKRTSASAVAADPAVAAAMAKVEGAQTVTKLLARLDTIPNSAVAMSNPSNLDADVAAWEAAVAKLPTMGGAPAAAANDRTTARRLLDVARRLQARVDKEMDPSRRAALLQKLAAPRAKLEGLGNKALPKP